MFNLLTIGINKSFANITRISGHIAHYCYIVPIQWLVNSIFYAIYFVAYDTDCITLVTLT